MSERLPQPYAHWYMEAQNKARSDKLIQEWLD